MARPSPPRPAVARRGLLVLCAAVAVVVAMAACATGSITPEDDGGASGGSGQGATGGAGGAGGAGGGAEPACSQPADCEGSDTQCSSRTCVEGECGVALQPEGTPCSDGGGTVCDAAGACVECIDGSQCDEGVCAAGVCADPSCDDMVANGSETDLDCGGSGCPPCADGLMCQLASDCISLFCDMQLSPPQCAPCVAHEDCAGVPGTYCDAGLCVPQKMNGSSCGEAAECSSGFCPAAEAICCDAACDSACESCLFAGNMNADGMCGPRIACSNGDGCCPNGCTAQNDDDCVLLDLNVAGHATLYSSSNSTRGFWFIAPVAFTIKQLRVPNEVGSQPQTFQVVKLTAPPPLFPSTTSNFVTLHYSTGTPGTDYLALNIPVLAGDVIGIMGARGSSPMQMSYSAANPVNSTIFSQPVTLHRLVYQASMVTAQAGPLSTENSGSIGRVELRYSN